MPNNGQINCDCAFWSPLILGTIIGVGVTVAADYLLPSEAELEARERARAARQAEQLRLAMRSNGGSSRRGSLPARQALQPQQPAAPRRRGGVMGMVDRINQSGW